MEVYVMDYLCGLYSKLMNFGQEEYVSQDGLTMDRWYNGALYRITGHVVNDFVLVDSIVKI